MRQSGFIWQVLREIPVLVEKPHCDDATKQHSAHMKAQSEPNASGVARIIK
jgi:hypothetical protein